MSISEEARDSLNHSWHEAIRTGCPLVGIDHIVLGILRQRDNDACRALSSLGVDLDAFKSSIDKAVTQGPPLSPTSGVQISDDAQSLLGIALQKSSVTGFAAGTRDILLALMQGRSSARGYLAGRGITTGSILSAAPPREKAEARKAPAVRMVEIIRNPGIPFS